MLSIKNNLHNAFNKNDSFDKDKVFDFEFLAKFWIKTKFALKFKFLTNTKFLQKTKFFLAFYVGDIDLFFLQLCASIICGFFVSDFVVGCHQQEIL